MNSATNNTTGILDEPKEGSDETGDETKPLLGTRVRVETLDVTSQGDGVVTKVSGCFAARYVLVVLGFLGLLSVHVMRVNLSVAIVAMTDYTPSENDTDVSQEECPGELNSTTHPSKSTAETFSWDEKTQGQILGAFFYGYIITQIPGGWLAGRFGGKWPLGLGVLGTALLTLLSPLAASAGAGCFVALRVLEGLCEGVSLPSMFALMSHWAPPLERTRMMTVTLSGSTIGIILSNAVTGVLCDSNFLGGWPSVFYLSGILGVIWFIFWIPLVYDTPAKHPRISQKEREYIEKSIGPRQETTLYLPVLSVITSIPVWAIIISAFCVAWGSYTLLTNLPNYLKNVLKFDITQSGFLSALPYVMKWIFIVVNGQLADFLRKRRYLSTGATRKLFNSLGSIIPGLMLAIVGYIGCDRVLAMVFLCVGTSGIGFLQSGYQINELDIAPKYAGVLFGITNTAASAAGALAPLAVGELTENNNTISQWQIVYWICFVFYMVSFVTFLLMGSGEEQPWAKDGYSPIKENVIDNSTSKNTDSEFRT